MTKKEAYRLKIGQKLSVKMSPYDYKEPVLFKGIGIQSGRVVVRVSLLTGQLLIVTPELVTTNIESGE